MATTRSDGRLSRVLTRSQRSTLWLRAMRSAERKLAAALEAHFAEIRAAVTPLLVAIEATPSEAVLDVIFVPADWHARILAAASVPLAAAIEEGAAVELTLSRKVRSVPLAWTTLTRAVTIPDAVRRTINRFTTRILSKPYWRDIHETLRADMAMAIRRGVKNGESPERIARDVQQAMGPAASRSRARLIARTESTGAVNAGAEAARGVLHSEGIVLGKVWVSVADEDVRDDHGEADGQAVGPRRYFRVGGELCLYPGDTRLSARQRCNCRCFAETIFRVDAAEDEIDAGEDAAGDDGL